jgi:uncharacterized membrane protein YhhN
MRELAITFLILAIVVSAGTAAMLDNKRRWYWRLAGMLPITTIAVRHHNREAVVKPLTLGLVLGLVAAFLVRQRGRRGANWVGSGVCAHAHRLKQRPDIGATVTADRANEALFQVG